MGQIKSGDAIDGEPTAGYSGRSVSLSSNGTTLAIGSPGTDQRGNETLNGQKMYSLHRLHGHQL